MRKLAIIAVAVPAIVLLAACGGGEETAGAEASAEDEKSQLVESSLTRAAYVKQVNSICGAANDEMIDSLNRYAQNPKGTPAEGIVEVVAPILEDEHEDIRKLGAPEGGAAKIEAYLEALQRSARQIRKQMPPDVFALQEVLLPVNSEAAAYGLKGCEF